jgi:hypothetical protein
MTAKEPPLPASDRTDDVLGEIDHVLDSIDHSDWPADGSPDAMRWAPTVDDASLWRPVRIPLAEVQLPGGTTRTLYASSVEMFRGPIATFPELVAAFRGVTVAVAELRRSWGPLPASTRDVDPTDRDAVLARARRNRGHGPPVQPYLATGRRRRR